MNKNITLLVLVMFAGMSIFIGSDSYRVNNGETGPIMTNEGIDLDGRTCTDEAETRADARGQLICDIVCYGLVWSPSGDKFAMVTYDNPSYHDIYTVNSDGSDKCQLTFTEDTENDPCWSADGNEIYFYAYRNRTAAIWKMNADGSDQCIIAPDGRNPSVSRSGERIAYREGSDLWLMDKDGSNGELLISRHSNGFNGYFSSLRDFSWSPNDEKLLLSDGNIWVIGSDGTGLTQLTHEETSNSRVCAQAKWSPDGTKIVYDISNDGIWLMNADGSKQVQIVSHHLSEHPNFSPDGNKIAYENGGIYIKDITSFIESGGGNNGESGDGDSNREPASWPMFQGNNRRTGMSPYSTSGNSARLIWKYETGDAVRSSPAIDVDGIAYVGSYDDHVYAINPDGSLKWKFRTEDDVTSSPAVGEDGIIYVGCDYTTFYAIWPSGTEKWSLRMGGAVGSSPSIGKDGTIYVGSNDGHIYSINTNGTLKWKYGAGESIRSSPTIGKDGTVYVGADDLHLHAIKPDGNLKWKYKTEGEVISSPAVGDNGTIYFGSNDRNLYSLGPDNTLNWRIELDGPVKGSPAIGKEGIVYVVSNSLYAVSADGSIKWNYDAPKPFVSSPVIAANGTVLVGSADGFLYAINPDGTAKWSFQTGDELYSSPAIGSDGEIYFGSDDSHIYAIRGINLGKHSNLSGPFGFLSIENTLPGHKAEIFDLAWSQDCNTVAIGVKDKSVDIWRINASSSERTLNHTEKCVSWSALTDKMATSLVTGDIKIWNTNNWTFSSMIYLDHTDIETIEWSPDGSMLAFTREDRKLRIYRSDDCQQIKSIDYNGNGPSISWSPDNKKIILCTQHETRIYDTGDWNCTKFERGYSSICWSPDGSKYALACSDGTVEIWSYDNSCLLVTLSGHNGSVRCLSWNPNGYGLASGSSDSTIKIWNSGNWSCVQTMTEHSKSVECLSWSPDGRRLASGSLDKKVVIWSIDSDRDGKPDNDDLFPADPHEWYDSDLDGVGNNQDDYPNDPAASSDKDGDLYPDRWNKGMSADDSTTGIKTVDAFPNDPDEWLDEDWPLGDGVGDNGDWLPQINNYFFYAIAVLVLSFFVYVIIRSYDRSDLDDDDDDDDDDYDEDEDEEEMDETYSFHGAAGTGDIHGGALSPQRRFCFKCGAEISAPNGVYCPFCGTDQALNRVQIQPEKFNECHNCGDLISPPLVFCEKCIEKMSEAGSRPDVSGAPPQSPRSEGSGPYLEPKASWPAPMDPQRYAVEKEYNWISDQRLGVPSPPAPPVSDNVIPGKGHGHPGASPRYGTADPAPVVTAPVPSVTIQPPAGAPPHRTSPIGHRITQDAVPPPPMDPVISKQFLHSCAGCTNHFIVQIQSVPSMVTCPFCNREMVINSIP